MKVLITGASGMVGKGVLLECLQSDRISSVTVVGRNSCGIKHEKLNEILHRDFTDFTTIADKLNGFDACFFCMGVSSAGLSEEKYRILTYDITLGFARILLKNNSNTCFCYVSGAGTDSTENGRMMWARVKGKTENDLMSLPFKSSYMFRPGLIQPMKGIKSKTKLYNYFYTLTKFLFPIFNHFPKYVTTTEKMGRAMINAAVSGYSKKILESSDINELAE